MSFARSLLVTSLVVSPLVVACDGGTDTPAPLATIAAAQGASPVQIVNPPTAPVPTVAMGPTTVEGTLSVTQGSNWHTWIDNPALTVVGHVVASPDDSETWRVNVAGGAVAATQDGAWTVDIGNTPTVHLDDASAVHLDETSTVQVSSLPPVELAGTPTVALAGTPTVAIANPSVTVGGSVVVDNDDAHALPVRQVDRPSHVPWARQQRIELADGEGNKLVAIYQVPAGHRLVIERIDGTLMAPTGQQGSVLVGVTVGGTGVNMIEPLTDKVPYGGADQWLRATTTKIEADGDTYVSVGLQRNDWIGTTATGLVTLSGYLTDEP